MVDTDSCSVEDIYGYAVLFDMIADRKKANYKVFNWAMLIRRPNKLNHPPVVKINAAHFGTFEYLQFLIIQKLLVVRKAIHKKSYFLLDIFQMGGGVQTESKSFEVVFYHGSCLQGKAMVLMPPCSLTH